MIDVYEHVYAGVYCDRDGTTWLRKVNREKHIQAYWVKEDDEGIWYTDWQIKDMVVLDQMKRQEQADILERAARSGAFGTNAQSTLLRMSEVTLKGSLPTWLEENGCRW